MVQNRQKSVSFSGHISGGLSVVLERAEPHKGYVTEKVRSSAAKCQKTWLQGHGKSGHLSDRLRQKGSRRYLTFTYNQGIEPISMRVTYLEIFRRFFWAAEDGVRLLLFLLLSVPAAASSPGTRLSTRLRFVLVNHLERKDERKEKSVIKFESQAESFINLKLYIDFLTLSHIVRLKVPYTSDFIIFSLSFRWFFLYFIFINLLFQHIISLFMCKKQQDKCNL